MNNTWKQITTAPFKQRVIVLFSDGKIGTMIFDDASDFKTTYATHWIEIPALPKQYNYRWATTTGYQLRQSNNWHGNNIYGW